MILSDDVVNKTMPVILCDEGDVAGTVLLSDPSLHEQRLSCSSRTFARAAIWYAPSLKDAIINAPEEISHRIGWWCEKQAN